LVYSQEAIPSASIILGNKVIKVFPKGFIEKGSMLSGIVGFITYLFMVILLIVILIKFT